MFLGQLIRYFFTTASGGMGGGLALLVPWLLLLIASGFIATSNGPPRLALIGGSGAFALVFAAPFVIDRLQGVGIPETVWRKNLGGDFATYVQAIADGDSVGVAVSRWVMFIGMLLLFAYVILAVLRLRPLLLGPAARSSFGIDMTVLLAVFAIAALAVSRTGVPGAWLDGLTQATSLDVSVAVNVRAYSWVVPLVVWLALVCRQGGALAVGATAGLVAAFAFVPWAVNALGGAIGDLTPQYAGYGANGPMTPYEALDWSGTKPLLAALSAVLLLIALWWSLGLQSSRGLPPAGVVSSSKVNTLSVVAFALSWFPITAIPGIVLGHLAYDQIVGGHDPQRGIGLARWSIVLGYLTLIGGAYVAYNTWG